MLTVSVIIPTYNRHKQLLHTLKALAIQDYFMDLIEVIVVDDGSSPPLEGIVNQDWPFNIHVEIQNHQGGTNAKNNGARLASGKVLFFLDDDIEVSPNCISSLSELHNTCNDVIVSGNLISTSTNKNSPFGRIYSQNHQRDKKKQRVTNINYLDTLGGFFTIKKDHFFDLGELSGVGSGWPNWEDVIFSYKAYQKGFEFLRCWYATGYHYDHSLSNISTYVRRWERASKSAVLMFHKYPDLQSQMPMFADKTPVDWDQDSPSLVIRKCARTVVSTPPITYLMEVLASAFERCYPAPRLLRPLYRWITGSYMYRGYRQGLRVYGRLGSE